MNPFDGMKDAQERGQSNKITPGVYPMVRVDRIKLVQGHNGTRVVVEMTPVAEPQLYPVEAAALEGVTDPREKALALAGPVPVGAQCSWVTQIDGKWGSIGLGECKSLLRVLGGGTLPGEETDGGAAEMARAVGPENPYQGARVSVSAWPKVTGNNHVMINAKFAAPDPGTAIVDVPPSDAPAAPAAPAPAPAPAPAQGPSPRDRAKDAGFAPNPNDPTGQWWWNASTGEQKQLSEF